MTGAASCPAIFATALMACYMLERHPGTKIVYDVPLLVGRARPRKSSRRYPTD